MISGINMMNGILVYNGMMVIMKMMMMRMRITTGITWDCLVGITSQREIHYLDPLGNPEGRFLFLKQIH
jgi:hypothetical protein